MVKFVNNIDLYEHISEYDIILVGTNVYCMMTQGFQRKIMLNYPYVQEMNNKTKYGDYSKLGTLLECSKEGEPNFTLLFICKGNFRPDLETDYLSYNDLEKCLKISDKLYGGKNVACTLLGTSRFDGNGNRERVVKIIEDSVKNMNLTVYDYYQKSKSEELKDIYKKEQELKKTNRELYSKVVSKRKKEADERKMKNGHSRY